MMRIVYEKTGEHPDGTLFTLEKGVATIPEDNHIVGVLGCSRCGGKTEDGEDRVSGDVVELVAHCLPCGKDTHVAYVSMSIEKIAKEEE